MAPVQLPVTNCGLPAAKAANTVLAQKLARTPIRSNPIDAHVGLRLLAARHASGLTQEIVAGRLNLSFQQIQKYEKGKNRISAGNLKRIADLYNRPITWFFEGAPTADAKPYGPQPRDLVAEMFTAHRGPELMTNYLAMKPLYKAAVAQLAASLAGKD